MLDNIQFSPDLNTFVRLFQLQVGLQNNVPQPHELFDEDDDVDTALNDLQISLEGSLQNGNSVTHVPQLAESLRYFRYLRIIHQTLRFVTQLSASLIISRPKRFTLKSFKRLFFVCRDLNLTAYKSSDQRGQPVFSVVLKGCEVTPEINLSQHKYQIKLEVPSADGMTEMWLRCDSVSFSSNKRLMMILTNRAFLRSACTFCALAPAQFEAK